MLIYLLNFSILQVRTRPRSICNVSQTVRLQQQQKIWTEHEMLSLNLVYVYMKLFRSGERLARHTWKAGRHPFRWPLQLIVYMRTEMLLSFFVKYPTTMRHLRLPARCRRDPRSSESLRSVWWSVPYRCFGTTCRVPSSRVKSRVPKRR